MELTQNIDMTAAETRAGEPTVTQSAEAQTAPRTAANTTTRAQATESAEVQTARAPAERVCAYEYTVRRGDSFYLISRRLGVPLRDLMAANSDIHPARLMVGDVLCIPTEEDDSPGTGGGTGGTGGGTVTPCENGRRVVLQEGQTVADLQIANGLNLYTLQEANPNVDLNTASRGQVVCVPRVNVPCPLPECYTLQSGDTLESVAVRFNLPIASLLRANACLAPTDFEAGVTVSLPR